MDQNSKSSKNSLRELNRLTYVDFQQVVMNTTIRPDMIQLTYSEYPSGELWTDAHQRARTIRSKKMDKNLPQNKYTVCLFRDINKNLFLPASVAICPCPRPRLQGRKPNRVNGWEKHLAVDMHHRSILMSNCWSFGTSSRSSTLRNKPVSNRKGSRLKSHGSWNHGQTRKCGADAKLRCKYFTRNKGLQLGCMV